MGRFKISKKNTYFVRLEHDYRSAEGNVRGVTTLQDLKNKAYLKYWIPKYKKNFFPSKMKVWDINDRMVCYPVTLTGNVRTSK